MALIKLNRSKTGKAPTSLADGELYVDQLNGRLYYIDASGVVRYFSSSGGVLTGDVTKPEGSTTTTIAAGVVTLAKLAAAAVASAADFMAAATGKLLTTDAVWGAGHFVGVPYAASITIDFKKYVNIYIEQTGPITFNNPTNIVPGKVGSIFIYNPGGHATTMGSYWVTTGAVRNFTSAGAYRIDYLNINDITVHFNVARNLG